MTINLTWINGKKTYIIGAIAILYGIFYHNTDAILIGLSAWGIRNGISNEIAKLIVSK